MANTKITALTALTGANSAPLDLLTLVDVSDATMAATGTNKSITRQELQTYNAGTLTTDVKVLDLSVTWNAAGVTFTGLKFNAVSTASAAGSLLMDLQLGGSTYFAFSKAGQLSLSQASVVGTPAIKIYDGRGFYAANGGIAFANDSGNNYLAAASGGLGTQITSGAAYAWTDSATSAVSTPDLFLFRDAANVLALRNSTTAQTLRVYNTWTDASNYERLGLTWASNVAEIGVAVAGTGTARNMDFLNASATTTSRVQMGTGTGRAPTIGTANVNTTAAGNVGAGEDDLITYALPTASLSAAGKGVHITAWGTTANNANAKTIKLYFGSLAIMTNALTINLAGVWRIEADVISTGTDAQDYVSQLVTTGAAGVALNDIEVGSHTQDDGAAITIKCTGTATDNNDILQEGMITTFLN